MGDESVFYPRGGNEGKRKEEITFPVSFKILVSVPITCMTS